MTESGRGLLPLLAGATKVFLVARDWRKEAKDDEALAVWTEGSGAPFGGCTGTEVDDESVSAGNELTGDGVDVGSDGISSMLAVGRGGETGRFGFAHLGSVVHISCNSGLTFASCFSFIARSSSSSLEAAAFPGSSSNTRQISI